MKKKHLVDLMTLDTTTDKNYSYISSFMVFLKFETSACLFYTLFRGHLRELYVKYIDASLIKNQYNICDWEALHKQDNSVKINDCCFHEHVKTQTFGATTLAKPERICIFVSYPFPFNNFNIEQKKYLEINSSKILML